MYGCLRLRGSLRHPNNERPHRNRSHTQTECNVYTRTQKACDVMMDEGAAVAATYIRHHKTIGKQHVLCEILFPTIRAQHCMFHARLIGLSSDRYELVQHEHFDDSLVACTMACLRSSASSICGATQHTHRRHSIAAHSQRTHHTTIACVHTDETVNRNQQRVPFINVYTYASNVRCSIIIIIIIARSTIRTHSFMNR